MTSVRKNTNSEIFIMKITQEKFENSKVSSIPDLPDDLSSTPANQIRAHSFLKNPVP